MKKLFVILMSLCLMLGVAGCREKVEIENGTEIAKILLANERLDFESNSALPNGYYLLPLA